MASLKEALKILFKLEHGTDENALHKNANESGLTYCGIYEVAHPDWKGWDIIKKQLKITYSMKEASKILMQDVALNNMVQNLYKEIYWDSMMGDKITFQHIANEIFIFGTNAGMKQAIKIAQRIVGAVDDGSFGIKTLDAVEKYSHVSGNVERFSKQYDIEEKAYYRKLVSKNNKLAINQKGWDNRAQTV